ncbi:MAG: type III-A CRISPR-associated RAMP protein Csm5 [Firmicutes bacterium]|nr:type III-A CRISPR-associated RAMP protein Csm5 [Bacillota bacterium]
MLKCYKVKIKTLAPVHIGSGQEIQKSEYVYDKKSGMLYVMDTYKLFEGLSKFNLLDRFEEFILRSPEATMTDFVEKNGITVFKDWAAYSYYVGKAKKYTNPIKGYVKDAYGMPYIPGSSLKGAIRSALLSTVLRQKNEMFANIATETEKERKGYNYLSRQSSELDVKVFHAARKNEKGEPYTKINNAVNSKMRGLIISDSKPVSKDSLIVCRKEDIVKDGTAKSISLLRECIAPNTELEFTMTIDTDVFKYSAETLEVAVKSQYKYIKTAFMDNFSAAIKNDISNGTLLFMGGGTGYVSKTVTYSLFYEKVGNKRAVKNTSKILHNVFYNDRMPPKMKKMASHINDPNDFGISPRVRKCTKYKDKFYDMGLCEIIFQPI